MEEEFRKICKQNVTIGRLTGNLLSQVTAWDIKFPNHPDHFSGGNAIEIPKAKIYYNLISGIRHNGDFAAASYRIELENVKLNVLRSKQDQWNVFHVFPPLPPGMPPQPPTFKGIIRIKNMSIFFQDEKGWAEKNRLDPFENHFTRFDGSMNFAKPTQVQFNLEGLDKENQTPVSFKGFFNPTNGLNTTHFSINSLDNDKWGNYLLALKDFDLADGTFSAQGTIKSKDPQPKQGLPFWYTIDLSLENATLKTPFFKMPFKSLDATLTLADKEKKTYTPDSQLAIHHFTGLLNTISLTGNGKLFLDQKQVQLAIHSAPFDLAKGKQLFPTIQNWKISGSGSTFVTLQGPFTNPLIKGTLTSPTTTLYAFTLNNVVTPYTFHSKKLSLFPKGAIYNGLIQGKTTISLQPKIPQLDLTFNAKNLDIQHIFPSQRHTLSGNIHLSGSARGPITRYSGQIQATSHSLQLWDQPISTANVAFTVRNHKHIIIPTLNFTSPLASSPLIASGNIQNLIDANLRFSGKGIPIVDPFSKQTTPNSGTVTINGTMQAKLSKQFWKKPLSELQLKLNANSQNLPIRDLPLTHLSVKGIFDQYNISLSTLNARFKHQSLSASGTLNNLEPSDLHLTLNQVNSRHFTELQPFIPESWQPVAGTIDLDLHIKDQPTQQGPWLNRYLLSGSTKLTDVILQNQPISLIEAAFKWQNNQLHISNGHAQHLHSHLYADGTYSPNGPLNITFSPKTKLNFFDFPIFTAPLGSLSGTLAISGTLSGELPYPNFDLNLNGNELKSTFLKINQLQGDLAFSDGTLSSPQLLIKRNQDNITISGNIDLTPILTDEDWHYFDLDYLANIYISHSKLTSISDLIESGIKEIKTKWQSNPDQPAQQIAHSTPQDIYSIQDPLFSHHIVDLYQFQSPISSLAFYKTIEKNQQELENPTEIGLKKLFNGTLNGQLYLQSRYGKPPLIITDLTVDSLKTKLLHAQKLSLKTVSVENGLTLSLLANTGRIAETDYQTVELKGHLTNDNLFITDKIRIQMNDIVYQDFFEGQLPLAPLWDPEKRNDPLNAQLKLKENNINILALLSPYITTMTNSGNIEVDFSGTLEKPVLTGKTLSLNNAQVTFSDALPFKSPLVFSGNTLTVTQNTLSFSDLKIDWKGSDTIPLHKTDPEKNQLKLAGTVSLPHFSLLQPHVITTNLNISASPTRLAINFEDIYNGDILIDTLNISGPYFFPLSQQAKQTVKNQLNAAEEIGPVLSASTRFQNGEITLPSIGKKKIKPPFHLKINNQMGKDVTIDGSLLGKGIFAGLANNFNLELSDNEAPVLISGTLNYPKLDTPLRFSNGSILAFGQDFELVPLDVQNTLYAQQSYKIQDNALTLNPELDETSGQMKSIPYLNLVALSVIDPLPESTSSENITRSPEDDLYKYLIIRISGSVYDLDNMTFEKFTSDRREAKDGIATYVNTYELSGSQDQTGTNSDISEVGTLLFPGLATTDSGQNDENTDQTQLLVQNIAAQQINTLVKRRVRPIEKDLAQKIGLYDLRLEYNVGDAILNQNSTSQELGLNLIANIIPNRIFLRVRTDLETKNQSDRQVTPLLSEVELSWKIYRNLSLNYANTLDETGTQLDFSRPEISLKFRHEY